LAGEEERRDPNLPNDAEPEGEPVGETQGSPSNPDIIDETGAVDDTDEVSEGVLLEEPAVPLAEFEAVMGERDQYLDSLRRLKAEFDNSRKRQERERARILESASEKLVQELLPVLDNLDRALESEGDIRGGVQATREHLAEVLANEGLLPVASDGQPFDPNVHEAVAVDDDAGEPHYVVQELRKGYRLRDRVLRPTLVRVGSKTEQ